MFFFFFKPPQVAPLEAGSKNVLNITILFIYAGATAVKVQVTGTLTVRTARLYHAMRTSTGAPKAS